MFQTNLIAHNDAQTQLSTHLTVSNKDTELITQLRLKRNWLHNYVSNTTDYTQLRVKRN